jgi:hypothetical protein
MSHLGHPNLFISVWLKRYTKGDIDIAYCRASLGTSITVNDGIEMAGSDAK